MLNNCSFIGRLTRTPELRHTQTNVAVVSFSLAVDRSRPTKDGEWLADFIDFVAWRGLAEKVAKYEQGDLLAVTGSLEIHPYTSKDGEKRNAAEIVADSVRKISARKTGATATTASNLEEFPEIPEEDCDLETPF